MTTAIKERCLHGHDRDWLPCSFCHPAETAILLGAPTTPEQHAAIAVKGAAMRSSNNFQVGDKHPRALKLEGKELAGCKVMHKAADATHTTRFHAVMACGHTAIIEGTILNTAERDGKKLSCKQCQLILSRDQRAKKSKMRKAALNG